MAAPGKARIAIIGAGLGGSAAAALLQGAGFNVALYEQAEEFSRLGAAIQLGPNLVKVLQRIGIAERVARAGISLAAWLSRKWDTGEELLHYPFEAEERYGAKFIQAHRGDFHALLIDALKPGTVRFGKRLIDLDIVGNGVDLRFEDGAKATADIVIGADGIRSQVRQVLGGVETPTYMGEIAHRAIFPTELLGGFQTPDYTKWWGEIGEYRMCNHYYFTADRKEYFVYTSTPLADWPYDSSSVPGDLDSVMEAFEGAHPDLLRVLRAIPQGSSTRWAQFVCEPLDFWSQGPVALLGDAVHPMPPYMGQGAAMAVEDASMLTRCLIETPTDVDYAFKRYETNRIGRTAKVQSTSRKHELWLRDFADPGWLFDYDAFDMELEEPAY